MPHPGDGDVSGEGLASQWVSGDSLMRCVSAPLDDAGCVVECGAMDGRVARSPPASKLARI